MIVFRNGDRAVAADLDTELSPAWPMAMAARPKLGAPPGLNGHRIEDREHVAGLEKGRFT